MYVGSNGPAVTQFVDTAGGTIAYDDSGGDGPLIVMLPGAGDIRSEYRLLAPRLIERGARVVTMDLRGHGESSADWPAYGIADTAADLIALLEHLGGGPATVVATSFSPTAAMWAAADRPDLIAGVVAISAHLHDAPWYQRIPLGLALRGPLAARLWASQYRGWHPGSPPADLESHAGQLAAMLSDPQRRRAVRETLLAERAGLAERITRLRAPVLVVLGGADSHFPDPSAEGEAIAATTGGTLVMVPDAGHYPHAEYPDAVAGPILSFVAGNAGDEHGS